MTRPLIVLCGAPGTGKSFEAFSAFQDAYAIISSPNNHHHYKKTLKKRPEFGRLPKRIKLIDTFVVGATEELYSDKIIAKPTRDSEGKPIPINQKAALEATIWTLLDKSMKAIESGEEPPYKNLIIDECGTFWNRVHAEILPTCLSNGGKVDGRRAYGETGEWSSTITNWLRQLTQCGVGVCLVLHDREPEGQKKGGPKMPSQTIAAQLCADADGVLQRIMKDPGVDEKNPDGSPARVKRLWIATASEHWHRKLRGLDDEEADLIGEMPLAQILDLAGYDMT